MSSEMPLWGAPGYAEAVEAADRRRRVAAARMSDEKTRYSVAGTGREADGYSVVLQAVSEAEDLQVAPVSDDGIRFVVASRDLSVVRRGIRSTIVAGSPVRDDDDVVRSRPDLFFSPQTVEFEFELRDASDDERVLRARTVVDNVPPRGLAASDFWSSYWRRSFDSRGIDVRDLECTRTSTHSFVVRGEVDHNASEPQPPVVNVAVNMPERRPRRARATRASDGSLVVSYEDEAQVEPQVEQRDLSARTVVVNVPEAQPPVVNVTNEVRLPDQPAPVVNVNIDDEPLDATVKFKRNSNGTIQSAEITENPQ